jgi:hypothetical protein
VTPRRQYWAAKKTHQRWVTARRARRNIRQTRGDTLRVRVASAETHPRRIFGPGFRRGERSGHFVSPAGDGTSIFGLDANDRSMSVCVARLKMPLRRQWVSHACTPIGSSCCAQKSMCLAGTKTGDSAALLPALTWAGTVTLARSQQQEDKK